MRGALLLSRPLIKLTRTAAEHWLSANRPSSATAEPASHRRKRKQRQIARGILAVQAARHLLETHHGGGMAGHGRHQKNPKEDWTCKTCDDKDGKKFVNFGSRKACLRCGLSKGVCFGAKAPLPNASAKAPSGARLRAEDIVAKRALEDKRALEHKHALEVKQLKDELAEARKASTLGVSSPGARGLMDLDGDDEPATSALTVAVERARDKLAKLKQLPEELRSLVEGGFDACCIRVQQELADAQSARRAAHPLKKQVAGAEAYKARLEKKLADEKAVLQQQEAQLADITSKIDKQKAAVREAEAAATKAATELASLAAQLASEHAVSAPAVLSGPEDGAQPPPGFVSVAFAEQKWAEREAEFAQKVAQLQALVDGQHDGVGSEAPDEALSESAEQTTLAMLDDDDTWSKVDRTKRKALLGREREKLATRVKASLNKVSSHASPFKKT